MSTQDRSAFTIKNVLGTDLFKVKSDGNMDIGTLRVVNDNVGIGTKDPRVKLHINTGASGQSGVIPGTDLTIESYDGTYMQMLSPINKNSGIIFGTDKDIDAGRIIYDSNGVLTVYAGNSGQEVSLSLSPQQRKINVAGDVFVIGGIESYGPIRITPQTSTSTCNSNIEGSIYYNKNDKSFYGCDGSSWKKLNN